jgi:hypothetical protein
MTRLVVLALLATTTILRPAPATAAADYPTKPIELVVPWAAGGRADIIMRLFAANAGKHLPQPIVVVNKPGGSGATGTIAVMNAPADGHMLLAATVGGNVIRPLTASLPYRYDSFAPVGQIAASTLVLASKADRPWKNLAEMVADAKKRATPPTFACPLLGFVTFNDEAEQYLVFALLRPGTSPAKFGLRGRLRTLFWKLRAAFPDARLRVRLDGGFAGEDVLSFLEAEGVEYVVAIGGNRRLEKRARRLMGRARMRSKGTGETAHVFGDTCYAAKKWRRKRRVIIKAEVVRHPGRPPNNNPRFVVTNLPHTPEYVYAIYRGRGDVENRIKELKDGVALDRLSCSRFRANQFRLLLTAAAYILFQSLRLAARGTAWATAQVSTLRERLLKLGVWLERSVRRIVVHFPAAFPWRRDWCQLAGALAATP